MSTPDYWSHGRISELEAENGRLREALANKDVEWSSGPERNKCPWCNGLYEEHRPNCERQKALWREEECDCEGIILKAGGHRVDCPLNEAAKEDGDDA